MAAFGGDAGNGHALGEVLAQELPDEGSRDVAGQHGVGVFHDDIDQACVAPGTDADFALHQGGQLDIGVGHTAGRGEVGVVREVVGFDHPDQQVPAGQGPDHRVDEVGGRRVGLGDVLHVEDPLLPLLYLDDGAGLVNFRLGQQRPQGGQHGHPDKNGDYPPAP